MYMKNVMMRGVGHSAGEERQGPSCRAGGGLPTQEQMREEATIKRALLSEWRNNERHAHGEAASMVHGAKHVLRP